MSCCCTGVVLAQIVARVGFLKFNVAIALTGALYFIAFLAAVTSSKFFDVITVLAAIVTTLCCTRLRWRLREIFAIPGTPLEDVLVSVCCGCCSVAQMASHVESYEPGTFAFAPRATLEGYSVN
jgi:Cys-rich protein (TIGR01571 family)